MVSNRKILCNNSHGQNIQLKIKTSFRDIKNQKHQLSSSSHIQGHCHVATQGAVTYDAPPQVD